MSAAAVERPSSLSSSPVFLAGPTGVGKSEVAVELAKLIGGEVVCGDAFQLYRGMGWITSQPSSEMMARVRHHLYGFFDPREEMSAAVYGGFVRQVIEEIRGRGFVAIVVGGSGLYMMAAGGGLDDLPSPDRGVREYVRSLSQEEAVRRLRELEPNLSLDWRNPRRVARALEIGLQTGRRPSEVRGGLRVWGTRGFVMVRGLDDLRARIRRNVEMMLRGGGPSEAAALGVLSETAGKAIGLREAAAVARGEMALEQAIELVYRATRNYAKRQMTWFRNRTSLPTLEVAPGEPAVVVARRAAGLLGFKGY